MYHSGSSCQVHDGMWYTGDGFNSLPFINTGYFHEKPFAHASVRYREQLHFLVFFDHLIFLEGNKDDVRVYS